MKISVGLFTGALFTVAAFSQTNDPSTQERFRVKYGRYALMAEARPEQANHSHAGHLAGGCCQRIRSHSETAKPTASQTANEERYRAKYGRNTPGEEKRLQSEKEVMATHEHKCTDGCCHLAKGPTADRSAAPANSTLSQYDKDRLRMKYGIEPAPAASQTAQNVADGVLASSAAPAATHECCKRSL